MLYSPGVRPGSTNEPSGPAFTVLTKPEFVPTALISAPPSVDPFSFVTLPRIVAVEDDCPSADAARNNANNNHVNVRLMRFLLFRGRAAPRKRRNLMRRTFT